MPDRRRTKIVATLGPATRSVDRIHELIVAGTDVFRLNFSHGTTGDHAENVAMIRAAAEQTGKQVGILGDLPGAKVRLGELRDGALSLSTGEGVTLSSGVGAARPGGEDLPVAWEGLPGAVQPGGEVLLADGRIRLRVLTCETDRVHAEVLAGGRLASHQGLNLPGAAVGLPAAGPTDIAWVDFAIAQAIDVLAVSFVRGPGDLAPVEERIRAAGADIPVMAKIERAEAAERAEELVEGCTAGIMVARGDLGVELAIEHVPAVQRRLLKLAGGYARASITATQMLASMVDSPRPTRAEVNDVASAILHGTDAVMLSEETAIGSHPVEAVRVMDRIARTTEPDLPHDEWVLSRTHTPGGDVAGTVARAAVSSAHTLGLAALVVPTQSGRTARLVSAHRPRVPVLAVSPRLETVRRLNLLFGVQCEVADQWGGVADLLEDCAQLARDNGVAGSGDLIGITAGLPGQALGTNVFEIHRVT